MEKDEHGNDTNNEAVDEKDNDHDEKDTELQETRERHRQEIEDTKRWYEAEMESLRQDLSKKLEEKDGEISEYKREISTLQEKMMYTHPTIPSSTSSVVARGITALVCKYILFVRFLTIVSH
jgi:t-SNARE complex subunit (syntaxin)